MDWNDVACPFLCSLLEQFDGTNSADDKKTTDAAVDQLTDGVPSETDKRGRPVKGHHVNGTGDAQKGS